jgi:tRNA(Ile)-lysidine synthase
MGQEGAARSARYAFLRRVATDLGDQSSDQSGLPITVVTAHHQDDQAETLLMHLIQGSGLNGLAGMAWKGVLPDSQLPQIHLVRPLLAVDRAAIHDYLHSYGLEWREDQSNQDHAYLRNQLRHQVLPLLATINPNIHATLARTADLLAAEAERADNQDQAVLAALIVSHTPSTRIVLDLFPLTQYDLATQRGVLRQALLTLGIDLRTLGMEGIDTLLEQVRKWKDSITHPLAGKWCWTLLYHGEKRHLSIHHISAIPSQVTHPYVASPLAAPILIPTEGRLKIGEWQLESALISPDDLPADWRSRAQPWRLFCDADVSGEFYLTTFQAGMTIAPLGMDGHQRSLGDIFTDHKIALHERLSWPVVVRMDGRVAWQCGVTVSEFVRIQPATRQVRHLRWKLEAENRQ